jgi:hypothetical protein
MVLAATATFIFSRESSRAQLALTPGPPPTINATSPSLSEALPALDSATYKLLD